ncbi:hypothetical protein ACFQV2_06075 [Actinokineospora soli]|uniref:Excalibur calcium-binding domain-containing protein n=1 Tax=Actinokineospora soli TaxID=1048753 RepID=A0ABW2TIK9_9PSEU
MPTPTLAPRPVLTPVPAYDPTAYAPAPTPKKSRVPLAFAGAVVGMVAVISGIASIGEDTPSAHNTVITVTTTVAPPTTTTTIRTTTTKPTTTRPKPTTTTKPKPKPTTPKPAPAPPPPPETTESDCDPNYSGCVPIASDVDCEGGSGNGPAYVAGPVRVIGSDIYGLDRDDDGIGCE